jgi:hypothetical protein
MTRRESCPHLYHNHRHTSVGLRWPLHTGVRTARVTGPRLRVRVFRDTLPKLSDTERGIRHNVTFRDIITFTYTAAHIMAHMLSRLGRSVRSIN